ncbi:MAG: D-alanyl-D-alanine carboxypeptidase [Micrococcales bacterium]|nr:D-alanyl-D-alanine carboxypeptidase [Micrococcales bacterium]
MTRRTAERRVGVARQKDDLDRIEDLFRSSARAPRGSDRPDPRAAARDREARQRRRRGAVLAALLTALVLALGGGYVAAALTAPLGPPVGAIRQPAVPTPPAATLAMPTAGEFAVSVSGADEYLGPGASGILAASGGDAAVPIASISKIIIAMVILEAKPLGPSDEGPTITFSSSDHALYDSYYTRNATIAEMPAGSSMSERDALTTMLVISASNYAEAVSTWAFGSQPAFLSATRRWLAARGLTSTTLVEPTGLDPRNRSTPGDLIALGRLAAADPVVSGIVAMPVLDAPGQPPLPNTNDLLGTEGVNGIKTGTLEPYGSNLLFSAALDIGRPTTLTVIGVLLGSGGRLQADTEVADFLASLRAGFHSVRVAKAGTVVGTYRTPWGSAATMVLASRASVFTWSDTPVAVKVTTLGLGSGRSGQKVGSISYTAGSATATVPVVLRGSIRPPTAWWRLTHPREVLGW